MLKKLDIVAIWVYTDINRRDRQKNKKHRKGARDMRIGIELTNKEETIRKMFEMAYELYGNYSKDKEMEIWNLCFEWNCEHEDDEIFMCETGNDTVNGFMIEDDPFYYEDMMK